MQLCIIYVFHYSGQFIILEYYFSNQNTKGKHIPPAFLQMQANNISCQKKKNHLLKFSYIIYSGLYKNTKKTKSKKNTRTHLTN